MPGRNTRGTTVLVQSINNSMEQKENGQVCGNFSDWSYIFHLRMRKGWNDVMQALAFILKHSLPSGQNMALDSQSNTWKQEQISESNSDT